MKENLMTKTLGLAVIFGAIVLTAMLLVWNTQRAVGSVEVTNEYLATTTDSSWSTATAQCKDTLTNFKTLGSVVVTKTSNAVLYVYDATTTASHTNHATTTVAAFPLTTVGTYIFDVQVKRGLCVVVDTTVGVASSTITVR